MAEVIDELLVKLGLETDKQEFQQTESMFSGITKAAIGLAGVVGAGLGMTNAARETAAFNDNLAKTAREIGSTATELDSLGFALQRSGGTFNDAIGTLGTAQQLLDDLRIGETGAFDAAALFLPDVAELQRSTDGMELLLNLSERLEGLSERQQRGALQALGLGGTGQFNLLTGQRENIESLMAEAQQLRPTRPDLVADSEDLTDATANLSRAWNGVTDEITERMVPKLTQAANTLSDLLSENREEIADFIFGQPQDFTITIGEDALSGMQARNLPILDIFGGFYGGNNKPDWATDELLSAVAQVESGGVHRDAQGRLTTSSAGARGMFQIMPGTGRDPGFGVDPLENNTQEEQRRFARDYLEALYDEFDQDQTAALAAYNAGPERIKQLQQRYGADWMQYAPDETQQYVPRVTEAMNGGGSTVTNNNTFNIQSTEPQAVRDEVMREFRRTTEESSRDLSNPVR